MSTADVPSAAASRLRDGRPTLVARLLRDPVDLALVMTLLLALQYSSGAWYTRVPVSVLAVAGLVYGPLRYARWFWFAVTLIISAGTFRDWLLLDNHKYLLAYWCLAVACCMRGDGKPLHLGVAARYLIGLSFLFALTWKCLSSDFLDGRFFQYALLFDPRFKFFVMQLAGAAETTMHFNEAARQALVAHDSVLTEVVLSVPSAVVWTSGIMTAWTLMVELIVTLLFLAPLRWSLVRWREVALLTFVSTTYLMAPVIGFGWVLTVMGFVQCPEDRSSVRLGYLALFVALQAYRLPWKVIATALLDS